MLSQRTMWALQAGLAALQTLNAGLATVHVNAWVALGTAAGIAFIQVFLQLAGNASTPPTSAASNRWQSVVR